MNTTLTVPNQTTAADQWVMHHRRYRGLRVAQALIGQFTMYSVELEQLASSFPIRKRRHLPWLLRPCSPGLRDSQRKSVS